VFFGYPAFLLIKSRHLELLPIRKQPAFKRFRVRGHFFDPCVVQNGSPSTSLRFSPFLLCGEVQNSSRFRIWNSANKPDSQGWVAQRRDSPDQLCAASSELAFCEQLTTKRCVIWATFASRGIRSSSKNFSVSSALRRCLRTTGEMASAISASRTIWRSSIRCT
jgi:hypothetical protein